MKDFRRLLIAKAQEQEVVYTELEYAQFDGSTYIDLGIKADLNTKAYIRYYDTKNAAASLIFGMAGGGVNGFGIWNTYYNNNHKFMYSFSNVSITADTAPTTTTNVWHIVTLDKTGVTMDGSVIASFSVNTPFQTEENLWLGALPHFQDAYRFEGRISILRLYENGVLAHEYVPAKDANNVVCFYDKVKKRLLYPATGTLTGGREIHRVEYLRNTGSSYIKTGILTWDNSLELEVKCTVEQQSSGTHSWWGAYNTWSSSGRQCPNIPTWSNLKPTTSFKAGTSSSSGTADIGIAYGQTGVFLLKGDTISWSAGTSAAFDRLTSTPFSLTQEIVLFCQHRGSTFDQFTKTSIYYAKFWLNNEVVVDFQPARDENNVGFMFDELTHHIVDNAGSGSFTYGADI